MNLVCFAPNSFVTFVSYIHKLPSIKAQTKHTRRISPFDGFRRNNKKGRFWVKDKGGNYLDANTSLAQLNLNFKSWKAQNAKDCFHAKWTLLVSWGKEWAAQVQPLVCVSMVLSLRFVNSTGVVVIVSHMPDTPRCRAHTHNFVFGVVRKFARAHINYSATCPNLTLITTTAPKDAFITYFIIVNRNVMSILNGCSVRSSKKLIIGYIYFDVRAWNVTRGVNIKGTNKQS